MKGCGSCSALGYSGSRKGPCDCLRGQWRTAFKREHGRWPKQSDLPDDAGPATDRHGIPTMTAAELAEFDARNNSPDESEGVPL